MDLMRKGVVFTMISLIVAGFLVVSFSSQIELPLDSANPTVSFRVDVLQRFTESWELFTEEALRTASYATLSDMIELLDLTNTPFSNYNELNIAFRQCLFNGTINKSSGTHQSVNCSGPGNPVKNNNTITYWLETMRNVSRDNMSLTVNYNLLGTSITQQFPFLITAELNMTYHVQDVFAKITKNVTIQASIPLEGLREPIAGMANLPNPREIRETGIKPNEWNLNNLTKFVNNKEFRHHFDAPSFLDRLLGLYTKSSPCCGIEVVLSGTVDGIARGSSNPNVVNSSYVDHMYVWDLINGPRFQCGANETYGINSLPDVQMDSPHLVSFNISTSDWVANPPNCQ